MTMSKSSAAQKRRDIKDPKDPKDSPTVRSGCSSTVLPEFSMNTNRDCKLDSGRILVQEAAFLWHYLYQNRKENPLDEACFLFYWQPEDFAN